MRLKVLTASLFVFGVLLLLAWPFVLGVRPPEDATRQDLARWGARSLMYFFVTCFAFLGAGMSAVLMMRENRRRYLEEMRTNVKDLIEGSLNDHQQVDR